VTVVVLSLCHSIIVFTWHHSPVQASPPFSSQFAAVFFSNWQSKAGEGQTPRRQLHQQFSALAANAGLTFRVVWLLPEDQWGLLPREVLQTANAPGSKLMLVSPLGADGVRASNGKLDALLDHGNVRKNICLSLRDKV